MSFFEIIDPQALGQPRGYSNGLLAPAGGRVLFIAGQVGWDEEHKIVVGGFATQFEQALSNVLRVVSAAGGGAANLGRLTLYVTDKNEYLAEMKEVGVAYRRVMGDHYPAMSLVEVAGLLETGAKIEIEGTAVLAAED